MTDTTTVLPAGPANRPMTGPKSAPSLDFARIASLLHIVTACAEAAPGQLSHISAAAMAELKAIQDDLAQASAAAAKAAADKAAQDQTARLEAAKAEAAKELADREAEDKKAKEVTAVNALAAEKVKSAPSTVFLDGASAAKAGKSNIPPQGLNPTESADWVNGWSSVSGPGATSADSMKRI
jgi:hypothetical protein